MTIEVLMEDYREMTYLTHEKVDQTEGFKKLDELYDEVVAAGFGMKSDEKIIDIGNYTEVPEAYLKCKPTTGTSTVNTASKTNTQGVGQFATANTSYRGTGAGYTAATTVVKKDPVPSTIERGAKSKKLDPQALEALAAKVDSIMAGDFEPQLPEIAGEEVDTEDNDVNTSTNKAVYGYGY
jgi:hypothetical protein